MNNQIFHWPRFVQCFLYFLRRDAQALWIVPLVMFGLAQFSLSTTPGAATLLGVMIASLIHTSRTCRELGESPASGLRLIMLPASSVEKILSLWILSAVIFPGLLLVAVWLAVDLRSLAIRAVMDGDVIRLDDLTACLESLPGMMMMVVRFWAAHAIFFWGSVFFRKRAFIKTAFMVFLAYMTLQLGLVVSFLSVCLIADGAREFGGTSAYWSHVGDQWLWIRSVIHFLPCVLALVFV